MKLLIVEDEKKTGDAAMVFFFKEINKRVLNMLLGFAARNTKTAQT